MKYWNDFASKYGFRDGDAYPIGVHVYQQQYAFVVNYFAEKMGSRYRVEAMDNGGIHNQLRIFWRLEEDDLEARKDDFRTEPAMLAAIDCARLYDPDKYIRVDFEIRGGSVTWDYYVDMDIEMDIEGFLEKQNTSK